MSRDLIRNYFDEIEKVLLDIPNSYIEQFDGIILNSERANFKLRVRFELKYLLAVSEALLIIDNQISCLDYRYHFQDEQNNLIFRYDSTPHFPELPNFPYHKHFPDAVIAHEKPEIADVLKEVLEFLK